MPPFEYLLLFASVILGLAACELAIGLNRLLGAWPRVSWDWLAPLAALLTFLKLVTQWWTWHGAARLAAGITFEMYLAVLLGAILLFMMAAAALPGTVGGDEQLDLRAHYTAVSRRFWILFMLHFVIANATSLWMQVGIGHATLSLASPVFLLLPLGLSLVLVRSRIWHAVALIGLCLVYFWQYFGQALPG